MNLWEDTPELFHNYVKITMTYLLHCSTSISAMLLCHLAISPIPHLNRVSFMRTSIVSTPGLPLPRVDGVCRGSRASTCITLRHTRGGEGGMRRDTGHRQPRVCVSPPPPRPVVSGHMGGGCHLGGVSGYTLRTG